MIRKSKQVSRVLQAAACGYSVSSSGEITNKSGKTVRGYIREIAYIGGVYRTRCFCFRRYGLSKSTVSYIVNRKLYKEV